MNSTRKVGPQSLLLISVIFFWFAQYVYIPYQTIYLLSIQTTTSFTGVIVGAYGISQMLLRIPVGILADTRNLHKKLIVIGAISSGTASLIRFFLPDGTGFLIANLFSGLASAMWISFMVLYMSFYGEKDQQKATSQIVMANNIGMLLGFIMSTLFYETVGMRNICLMSLLSGLLCAGIAMALPAGEEKHSPCRIPDLLRVCLSKRLLLFSLLALVQQGVQMSTTMSFTSQIIRELGAGSGIVGFSSILYMASAVLTARFAGSRISRSFGSARWIPLVLVLTGLYCILVPNCTSVVQILPLQILPGMSTGILFTNLTSEAMRGVPAEKKSTAMGFYQAVYALGMTLLPMISGRIMNAFSMKAAFFVLAAICLAAAAGAMIGFYITDKK